MLGFESVVHERIPQGAFSEIVQMPAVPTVGERLARKLSKQQLHSSRQVCQIQYFQHELPAGLQNATNFVEERQWIEDEPYNGHCGRDVERAVAKRQPSIDIDGDNADWRQRNLARSTARDAQARVGDVDTHTVLEPARALQKQGAVTASDVEQRVSVAQ
jgi:hypothetical protein